MSSKPGERDVPDNKTDIATEQPAPALPITQKDLLSLKHQDSDTESFSRTRSPEEVESGTESSLPGLNGTSFQGYGKMRVEEPDDEPPSPIHSPQVQDGALSPGISPSIPDDTPSIRGSILSSPGSSVAPSNVSTARIHRPGGLQPFDRRFSSRLSLSPTTSSRNISPAFLYSRSRQSSISSTLLGSQGVDESETPQPPWEVVRWTKLRKITGQVFSETGRRNYGRATVLAIGVSIVIGTSKGLALVFDFHQNLIVTIGLGTKAVESGSVTSLAISADNSTIATGHASGHIFTWEVARPAKPFLHIPPLDRATLDQRRHDGHVAGVPIVHVGFLGIRHTALVSADEGGMGFSHLATRGLGAVARNVKTTRILGRYPIHILNDKARKASSVLAFAPLPLGNVEQPTDTLGLTALLTPYLLVIVSTTPIAETQFKTSRPKDVAPHSALSGCLAWFPAVKLKAPPVESSQQVSLTKLAYCWSNILTILDVHADLAAEKDKPPTLHFKPRSRWRNDEAIVAIQWLSRSVLGVLTISQRLIILEDPSLRVTDTFDLIHMHIFHQDLFSRQLHRVVEQLDDDDSSMHGVVADAFHMSFRSYKGRIFLLGFNDISVGVLSNWADRLMALMEEGDYISAVQLATSYYAGDTDKITVGLPEDDAARHELVQEKLSEMVSASLKYTFSHIPGEGSEWRSQLRELTAAMFAACKTMQDLDFLFEDVFDAFQGASAEDVFFDTLEPYILDEEITAIPPQVLKDLISHYASNDRADRLEEMICRLETQTMDIHQITNLCRKYRLYDALIYVWNQAIGDYITPLIDLLTLLKGIETNVENRQDCDPRDSTAGMKLFTYLACALTGRIYPAGVEMDESDGYRAKAELYRFLFSGNIIDWPPGSGQLVRTKDVEDDEPPYPYLSLILRFDTPSFLSMLNEAFEDYFLNGASEQTNGDAGRNDRRGLTHLPTRQTIIGILMELMGSDEFGTEDSIYLDMFIARNLPKFPQFIILPGSTLHKTLEGLCSYPSDELAEDCQLSVEYLLSFYHPSDLESLVPLFERARFFRVLKTVYKGLQLYAQLVQTYFDDPNARATVFDCVADCLRPGSGLTAKQIRDVEAVIITNAKILVSVDTVKAADILHSFSPHLLEHFLSQLEGDSQAQFILLRTLMEPSDDPNAHESPLKHMTDFEERYVRLMCRFDPSHVADYVGLLKSGDLRLKEVLPAMESSGVIDAAVVLLVRDGLVREAMDRLVKHMSTLRTALTGLIGAIGESPDVANTTEAIEALLENIEKYSKVGIWLCQGQTRITDHTKPKRKGKAKLEEEKLKLDEELWVDLVDVIVAVTREVSAEVKDLPDDCPFDPSKVTLSLRNVVQQTFSSLLTSTTRPQLAAQAALPATIPQPPATQPHPSFLRILRAFLTRASDASPSLSDLRGVLAEIFAAYTFEETILDLANQFLDKDLFKHVEEAHRLRQRGWRPRGNTCEKCKRRVWGPGVGGDVWEKWEARQKEEELVRRKKMAERRTAAEDSRERGKGRATAGEEPSTASAVGTEGHDAGQTRPADNLGPLLVFACRHIFHRVCLEEAIIADGRAETGGDGAMALRCPLPHGG
ncbi:hypothetical protein EJ06DRAFT_579783 [Trichodelitschia bisporula]|uniref:Uncharacterized protein n=1 Tax=Trichodelitschia bisporula TaxID=703511 RepID=A0A6G1I716_9PEZI|nr:hypothetical protein EJ06DRAFT_579783 [Trichodelitschia bisporula]